MKHRDLGLGSGLSVTGKLNRFSIRFPMLIIKGSI